MYIYVCLYLYSYINILCMRSTIYLINQYIVCVHNNILLCVHVRLEQFFIVFIK